MATRKWEQHTLSCGAAKSWVKKWGEVRSMMVEAGYPDLHGAPLGHLLDITPIAEEASRFAGRVRSRECQKQNRDVPVGFDIIFVDGSLIARADYVSAN